MGRNNHVLLNTGMGRMALIFDRHFSVDEVAKLIPWVETQLKRIRRLRTALLRGMTEPTAVTDQLIPDSFPPQLFELFNLMRSFEERDILLRDPEIGMVHFPHLLGNGEEVLLCYLQGENEPYYYHSLADRYGLRLPLPS